jgi:CotH kinase protein/Chitobiase/beta-hexosaminidase C-terminal domain/Lamin Tail Domain
MNHSVAAPNQHLPGDSFTGTLRDILPCCLMKSLLTFALIPALVSAAPVINEFVAENQHGITDEDGTHSDWVEIYNPDPAPVNMSGWFLTDDAAVMNKWAFPPVAIPPGGLLVVFASGKNRAIAGSELHANFSLDAGGEYLALSQPGGAGVTTEFAPGFPAQRDGFSFGRSQDLASVNVLAAATPTWLVPTTAGALAADWNEAAMAVTAGWQSGAGTGAVGYETAAPPVTTGNITTSGAATQSTTNGAFTATVAKDANYTNFSHTVGTDASAIHWWQNAFTTDREFGSIKIFNRTSCCQSRLRDVTVKVLNAGGTPVFPSALLNPENTGYAYPGGPTFIELNLVALTGSYVVGRTIRVERAGDPDLSGTAGQGNADEARVLSMAEVEIVAVTGGGAIGGDSNLAPAGAAAQTSTLATYSANLGINNNTADFTHTLNTDMSPKWTLNLGGRKIMSKITLSNRTSCCGSRLRDIRITVKDQDNSTVTYTSALLNPENAGYAYPNGPAALEVDFAALTGGYILGQYIEVTRIPDLDLSATQGQGGPAGWVSGQVSDEGNVISLGEVTVIGNQFGNYQPLITTDVKTAMLNVNTSAFIRWPFTVANPADVTALKLRVRYDDGFIAFLNGVEIARRNATGVTSVWNSAATGGDRDDAAAVNYEDIDVTALKTALLEGANTLAIQGLTSATNDPDFLLQPQFIVDSLTVQPQLTYLRTPTAAALNDATWFLDFVKDTSFSVKRGFYTSAQSVALSTLTPGATIRFTTNGSTPTETNGTVYSAPINIAATTVLRARAFKADWEPTNTDTQTYLFLSDVLAQTASPPAGWPASPVVNSAGQSQLLNYGMDQNVRALYGDAQMLAALTQLPSISIVTDQSKLTDPLTGIYTNAYGHGEEWERDASIEWLNPSKPAGAQGEFQHNFGLRIRGGYSRNPQYVKHSFRLYFRDSYSVGKLNFPIFGASGTSEHDVIDLASSQNYSWAVGGGNFETMVRDPFARQTLLDCGSPGSRTRYFHLYLNGVYWGLYWFDERPSAGYGEAYFGGSKDDWDVIKTGNHNGGFVTEATDGFMDQLPGGAGPAAWRDLWNKHRAFATAPGVTSAGNPDLAAYFAMLGCNADGTRNPALPVLVNVDSLIDYMLCIFYTGDGDAPLSSFLGNDRANNWFAIRSRANDIGFIFLNHDAEHTLGTTNAQNDRTGPFNGGNQTNFAYSNPQWIFQDLAFSPEFRLRVADRAHRHLFNGGAMTPAVAQARMDSLSSKINLAVKGHSMRWGDVTKSPAYNATDWQNAVTVARNYLAARHTTIISQLRAYNLTTAYPDASAPLYPLTNAPVFSQHGGNVAGGYNLTITATAGTIYFSTNGTDPRAIGGAAAGSQYTAPVQITAPLTVVKARALNGGVWSALTEAAFYADTVDASAANIVISEIHYHPTAPTGAEFSAGFTDGDDFEYIEMTNIAASGVRLTGCYFDQGITFNFPATVLAPGARLVLARNAAAFAMRYGFAPAGAYTGGLSNGGENLRFSTASGAVIKQFAYGVASPWPAAPDGAGPSLVLRRPALNEDHGVAVNWRASFSITPGGSDSGAGYAAWKSANGIASDTADDDGDTVSAFLEYALGGSLTADSRALLPTVHISGGNVVLTVHHALVADDVTWIIQSCTDLVGWAPEPAAVNPAQTSSNGVETLTYTFPPGPGGAHFYRVKYMAP